MARSERCSVELDWCDEDGDPHAQDYASSRGLVANVIEEHGPGGGWPIIEFIGPRDDIELLVREHEFEDVDIIDVCDICGSKDNVLDGLCSRCNG